MLGLMAPRYGIGHGGGGVGAERPGVELGHRGGDGVEDAVEEAEQPGQRLRWQWLAVHEDPRAPHLEAEALHRLEQQGLHGRVEERHREAPVVGGDVERLVELVGLDLDLVVADGVAQRAAEARGAHAEPGERGVAERRGARGRVTRLGIATCRRVSGADPRVVVPAQLEDLDPPNVGVAPPQHRCHLLARSLVQEVERTAHAPEGIVVGVPEAAGRGHRLDRALPAGADRHQPQDHRGHGQLEGDDRRHGHAAKSRRCRVARGGIATTTASAGHAVATVTPCRRIPTPRSSAPADGSPRPTSRCGSCVRPDAPCPSTAPSAARAASSTRSASPTWPPRSPSSRSGGTASTRRSSTPTSWCPSRRSASASTWPRAPVRWWRSRSARPPTSTACDPSSPRSTRRTCSRRCATSPPSWATRP